MKILLVNTVCGIRSTGRMCTDLADTLRGEGHRVGIAYGRERVPEKDAPYALRIGSDRDVRLHALKARLLDASGFGSKKATERFVRAVADMDPDLIHLHNLHGYYLHLEVLFDYLRSCRKKIIWTLHDGWAFAGHSAVCAAAGCEKWRSGCGACPLMREYPASFVDRSRRNFERKRAILQGIPSMTLVTPSRFLAEQVRQSFLGEYPVRVIPNGIDTSVFRPTPGTFRQDHGIRDRVMLLGVATSWDDMKGLNDFIALADRLDDRYRIVMVGVTPKVKKRLPDRIIALERTDSTGELAALYSQADLVMNLSKCENYPMINLEAMACGTPVITYRVGGSPESVEGHGGIVVGRGDLEAVVRCLETVKRKTAPGMPLADPAEMDKRTTGAAYRKLYLEETGAM